MGEVSTRVSGLLIAGLAMILGDPGSQASLSADDAVAPRRPLGTLKVIEPEDVTPADGLLLKRALATYDMYKNYTPKHVLTLNYSTQPSDHAFPGDTIGRYILSATLLSRILHQPEPDTLKQVMAALPSMLNAEGYLGWVLPKDRADETGLSNVMWSNGLTEYALWTKDAAALKMNRNIFDQIILPIREAYYYYYSPEKNDGKIKWVHCTGDTAQGFGIIDPATRGYQLFPSEELKSEINELIRLYRKLDHVKIQSQTHAYLFTTRGILRWYELQGNPEHLEFAQRLYDQYRRLAMTENYENFNWFGKPKWTEGCTIVDSLTVALKLWQLTGNNEYLEDAHLILFNALLANQKHGDFGTDNCVGSDGQIFLKDGSTGIAPWCCSVWGGKGFARTMQYSQFLAEHGVVIAIPGNNTITARLPDGEMTVKQTTGYPREGGIRFEVMSNASQNEREIAVFLPSWILPESLKVVATGAIEPKTEGSLLRLRGTMSKGDVIDIQFEQAFRCAPPLYPDRMSGRHRYLYGPLVLGVDAKEETSLPKQTEFRAIGEACYRAGPSGPTLVPLCDLRDLNDKAKQSRTGSVQILFQD